MEDVKERIIDNARNRRVIPYMAYVPREKPKGLYALYKKMEDFPKAEEYFANLVAYDDEETEAMCDYLENKNEKEKSE